MKKYVLLGLLAQVLAGETQELLAQNASTKLFRSYWDNDFFNIRGQGTDESYTNGFRFDLFYEKSKTHRFSPDRLFPKAGVGSVDATGWGLGQCMMTPRDLSRTEYQPGDYPYAGALAGIRSLYSYNPEKKYSFQTEVMFGVRGPESFAAQTQIFIHRLIGDGRPMGWNNQLGTKLILNINFTFEKQLAHYRNAVEVIGGGQSYTGTLFNGLSTFAMLRIGKMTPYFNGYISQHASGDRATTIKRYRLEAYGIIRPGAGIVINNEMLGKGTVTPIDSQGSIQPPPSVKHWDLTVDYGAFISSGRVSFSFIQKSMSAMLKGLPSHEVGNLSFYYSW